MERFDWDALQTFLAVVRAGRLTTAARNLGQDHSTVSRRITRLERSLQAKLFIRRTSGYTLTSQGERLLELAQDMESKAMAIVAEIAGSRLQVAGTVRIGAPDGFGIMFLAPRIHKLLDAHPALEVQLVTLPRIFSISKREADIAVILARPERGRLHSRKLTDYELGLYASNEYLSANPPIDEIPQLQMHRFIGYVSDMIYAPELDYLPLVSQDLRPSLSGSNLLAQFGAKLAGGGLCILPYFMANSERRLVRVLPNLISLTRTFWLVVHTDMRDLARIRVVSDFIANEVRVARHAFVPKR